MAKLTRANRFQNEVKETINKVLTTKDDMDKEIQKLKKNLHPYMNIEELKELMMRMNNEDVDTVKRFLSVSSNIVYQKDFKIDNKEKFIYHSDFNNNSHPLNFSKKKVLLILNDYSLNSYNFDFFIDVYKNGVRMSKSTYVLDPGSANYKFTPGSKRIFIDQENVSDGDLLSVVVRKCKQLKSYYISYRIENELEDAKQIKIPLSDIGDFENHFDNLMVFKKNRLGNSLLPLDEESFCFVYDDIERCLMFNILETLKRGDVYVIVNRLKSFEITKTTDNELSLKEYLEEAVIEMNITVPDIKVEGRYELPLPVRKAEELEITINGLRLIPSLDYYIIPNDITKNYRIKFAGIVKQGAEIIIRNVPLSNEYGFFQHKTKINEEGFIKLNKYCIPISMNYTEAFLGRRRVAYCDKRVVGDTILKIDNQETFNDLMLVNDIYFNQMAYQTLSKYNENKPLFTRLSDTFGKEVIDAYKAENELRPNTPRYDEIYNQTEIFLGIINTIKIIADRTVVTEGITPKLTVIGYYSQNQVMGVDITEHCTFSGFDPFQLGEQTITATYKSADGTIITDSIKVNVINKDITGLKIVLSSNFFVVGDRVRDVVRVLATFEDNSEKYVTDQCVIDAPEFAEHAGTPTITAKFTYNGEEIIATKVIMIADESERIIEDTEIIVDNYLVDETDPVTKMSIVATYNNDLIQKIDNDIMNVYIVDNYGTENQTESLIDINNVRLLPNKDYIIAVDIFVSTDKQELVRMAEGARYNTVRLLKSEIEADNRMVIFDGSMLYLSKDFTYPTDATYFRIKNSSDGFYITIGKTEIGSDALCFGDAVDNQLVIVEFLDAAESIIDQKLFKLRDSNMLRETIRGTMVGSPIDSFTVTLSKISLGKELAEIKGQVIKLFTKDKEEVLTLNPEKDLITEDDSNITFNFCDYSTKSGSILKIQKAYLNNNRYFELVIPNIDKNILIQVESQRYERVVERDMFITTISDEKVIAIVPNLPRKFRFSHGYTVRPNNNQRMDFSLVDGRILIPINASRDILYGEEKFGLHKFYMVHDEGSLANRIVCEIDVTIDRDVANEKVRITEITEREISFDTYMAIQEKTIE